MESRIFDVEGVLDVSGMTLNGQPGNVILRADEFPAAGEVILWADV
jgi:hypothetical protein